MLVKNWMNKNVITINADDSMTEAIRLLKEKDIRLLPVMEKSKLVGVVTDQDLKDASSSDVLSFDIHELFYLISKIKIRNIMSKDPITVPMDYTLEETAEILLKNQISGVPVLDQNGGIMRTITQKELFRALISLTSYTNKGFQFAFQVENQPGSIKKLTDIIRKNGGRIAGVLSTFDQATKGYRLVYIRAYDVDRNHLDRLLTALKEAVTLLYFVDHRENKREIYGEKNQ